MSELIPYQQSPLVPVAPSIPLSSPRAFDVPMLNHVVHQIELTAAALNLASAGVSDDNLDEFEQLSRELEQITAETADILEDLENLPYG